MKKQKAIKPKSILAGESMAGWTVEQTNIRCPNCDSIIAVPEKIKDREPETILICCGECECDFQAKKQEVVVWVSIRK